MDQNIPNIPQELPQQPEPSFQELPKENKFPKFLITILIIAGVLIAGYFAVAKYQKLWPFEIVVEPIPLAPSPTATPDETSNWKTYRNEEYGFEFKYPSYLNIDKTLGDQSGIRVNHVLDLSNPERIAQWKKECANGCMDAPQILSIIVSDINNTTLDQYVNGYGYSASRVKTTLRGKPAYQETRGARSYYYITTENKGRIFELWFPQVMSISNIGSVESQILSTFKFTE